MRTKLLLLSSILMLLAVAGAYGQTLVKSNVPFQFIAAGKTLPAGSYAFIHDTAGELIKVVGTAKDATALVPIITRLGAAIHTTKQDTHLVFDQVGAVYTLSEIWVPGQDGLMVAATKGKHEHKTIDVPR